MILRFGLPIGGVLTGLAVAVSTASPGLAQAPPGESVLDIGTAAKLALDHHPATARARADLTAAETAVRIARAPLFPMIALSGSTVRFQEPMVVAPLHAFDPTRPPSFDQTLVQGAVQASYTLSTAVPAEPRPDKRTLAWPEPGLCERLLRATCSPPW